MSGIRNLADNVSSISSNVQSQIDLKAPLANPTLTSPVTIDGNNISPFTGFKNYIINGNFDVWQRGTDVTTSSASEYRSVDRWINVGYTDVWGVGENRTYKSIDSDGSNVMNIIPSVGTTRQYFDQRIENPSRFSGKTLTLSFWIKINSGTLINSTRIQNKINGSYLSDITSGEYTVTTSWQKITYTFTMPSFGTTFQSNDLTVVSLISGKDFVGRTISIKNVQLEQGSVATPFEQRPYGLELSLCQRYYETGSYNYNIPYATINTGHFPHEKFSVTKRVSPSIVLSSVSANNLNTSSFTLGIGLYNFEVYGATMTATGQANLVFNWSANAEL